MADNHNVDFEIVSNYYVPIERENVVAVLETYLPAEDRTVWASGDSKSFGVTSIDYYAQDAEKGWRNWEDLEIYAGVYESDSPASTGKWRALIEALVAYTIQQYGDRVITLPLEWVPEAVKEQAPPGYLDWFGENRPDGMMAIRHGAPAPDPAYYLHESISERLREPVNQCMRLHVSGTKVHIDLPAEPWEMRDTLDRAGLVHCSPYDNSDCAYTFDECVYIGRDGEPDRRFTLDMERMFQCESMFPSLAEFNELGSILSRQKDKRIRSFFSASELFIDQSPDPASTMDQLYSLAKSNIFSIPARNDLELGIQITNERDGYLNREQLMERAAKFRRHWTGAYTDGGDYVHMVGMLPRLSTRPMTQPVNQYHVFDVVIGMDDSALDGQTMTVRLPCEQDRLIHQVDTVLCSQEDVVIHSVSSTIPQLDRAGLERDGNNGIGKAHLYLLALNELAQQITPLIGTEDLVKYKALLELYSAGGLSSDTARQALTQLDQVEYIPHQRAEELEKLTEEIGPAACIDDTSYGSILYRDQRISGAPDIHL